MKKEGLLIALACIITGCATQKNIDCCSEKENHQCDELYPYYNCPDGPVHGYHYRDYKKYVNRTADYAPYYPNTQTVYYVTSPQGDAPLSLDNDNVIRNTPRPEKLGHYGNTLNHGEYWTRDNNGHRVPGSVLEPRAPRITKDRE